MSSSDLRPFLSLPRIPSTPMIAVSPDPPFSPGPSYPSDPPFSPVPPTSTSPPPLPRRRAMRKSDETHLRVPSRAASLREERQKEEQDQGVWWAGIAKWAGRLRRPKEERRDGWEGSNRIHQSTPSPPPPRAGTPMSLPPRTISLELVRTFGIPLEVITDRERDSEPDPVDKRDHVAEGVPRLVRVCVEWIEANAIDKEGLYRVPGSHRKVQTYQLSIDTGAFDYVFPVHESPHTVASLLKKYLASIPGGIWGGDDVKIHLRNAIISTPPAFLNPLLRKTLISPSHFNLVRYLTRHLSRITAHSNTNKMTPENLAIVMFPGVEALIEVLVRNWEEVFGREGEKAAERGVGGVALAAE
ncbi:hypothetical protein SpCBS45565_g03393 [Spizellomyces sp. 'palustris']|nr:hypothetical protein SpCBS45565_g03393 [Spizellomyces sp. 'palustris']